MNFIFYGDAWGKIWESFEGLCSTRQWRDKLLSVIVGQRFTVFQPDKRKHNVSVIYPFFSLKIKITVSLCEQTLVTTSTHGIFRHCCLYTFIASLKGEQASSKRLYLRQTILDAYLEMVFATIRTLQRKADNDAFFYAFSFVWQSVALNIQPYWIWLIFYWWTLSWQSYSCSSFETIPVSLKSSAVREMRPCPH